MEKTDSKTVMIVGTEPTKLEILKNLGKTKCFGCEGSKLPKRSFCLGCYRSLPPEKKQSLYRRYGNGYCRAFRDALDYIKGIDFDS